MNDDPYLYPNSSVLRNKHDITDAARLDYVERELVVQRSVQGVPEGNFDLQHLQSIHRHLFQDTYDWAGELRTVEIAKGGDQFQFRQFIETGMRDVHRRLEGANFLRGLSQEEFTKAAGIIMGDVNYVHPFREGNGRTQLFYLDQLAERAGHPLDLTRLDPQRWIAASRAAHIGEYGLMRAEISAAIVERTRTETDAPLMVIDKTRPNAQPVPLREQAEKTTGTPEPQKFTPMQVLKDPQARAQNDQQKQADKERGAALDRMGSAMQGGKPLDVADLSKLRQSDLDGIRKQGDAHLRNLTTERAFSRAADQAGRRGERER